MRLKKYIKDIIYGANDGVITTFAVIAGIAGAGLSNSTMLIVGIASLFADAFSMASSNYLGTQAEIDALEGDNEELEPYTQIKSAAYTFFAFIIAGTVPLLPLLFYDGQNVFLYSIIATGIALFMIGAFRTLIAKTKLWVSGLEMLLVGGVAAVIAYGIGAFVQSLVG